MLGCFVTTVYAQPIGREGCWVAKLLKLILINIHICVAERFPISYVYDSVVSKLLSMVSRNGCW